MAFMLFNTKYYYNYNLFFTDVKSNKSNYKATGIYTHVSNRKQINILFHWVFTEFNEGKTNEG